AGATDAAALLAGWKVTDPTAAEKTAFRDAFFSEAAVGTSSPLGRRSSTLALIRALMSSARRPLVEGEIRRGLTYRRVASAAMLDIPETLEPAWYRWAVLQVRQFQRFAMECLLAWTECRVILQGDRDSDALCSAALHALESHGFEGGTLG